MKKDWFESWFNTPYYHILYKHRDENEAQLFIENLLAHLPINSKHRLLDLACGRGRHARFLHSKGFSVTGIDLSEKNIEFALQFENEDLQFKVGDMRKCLGENQYDAIFNLFTSFGYFDTPQEHQDAINKIAKSLKNGGYFVQDFMNTYRVERGLVAEEVKIIDEYIFNISRHIENDKIIKTISFTTNQETKVYKEKVSALTLEDFEKFYHNAGLEIINRYGNFNLAPFQLEQSDRLILISRKK